METDEVVEMLRKRVHSLRANVATSLLIARAAQHRLDLLEPKVETMLTEDRVEREVVKRLHAARTLRLTFWQKLAALIVSVLTVADFAFQVAHGVQ